MLMDNIGMPPVQTNSQPVVEASQSSQVALEKPRDNKGVMMAIIIVLLVVSVGFAALSVWALVQYNNTSASVEGQIAEAVATAKKEQAEKDELEFAEREKDPYRDFSGPADYGELSFEYPKTWSVYVASDASKGGDFEAYFNPIQVEAVSKTTINALRLTIRNKDFESVAQEYQRSLENKDSNLRMDLITVGGATANRYTGTIPGTELNGYIVIFKIRDKTAIFRTDSVLFTDDFDRLLETVSFNA